jgi:prephenate dehydratase
MPSPRAASRLIAFQGEPGAYSHLACRHAFPRLQALPCHNFDEAFAAVQNGKAGLAMIAIDNSVAGRVADVYALMPRSGLYIVGEHFERVHHYLLAPKGATLKTIKSVESHIHALNQCRVITRKLNLKRIVAADTAGAAAEVARAGDVTRAAIASSLAGEIHGLVPLLKGVEDAAHNTTRFVVLSHKPKPATRGSGKLITSFVFQVRNVPAALYKAMGGFATNGINMTKLESYMVGGSFSATQFYADVEGHPDDPALRFAFEELRFFAKELRILGVYPAHPFRENEQAAG